jgi:hypothetical protein
MSRSWLRVHHVGCAEDRLFIEPRSIAESIIHNIQEFHLIPSSVDMKTNFIV